MEPVHIDYINYTEDYVTYGDNLIELDVHQYLVHYNGEDILATSYIPIGLMETAMDTDSYVKQLKGSWTIQI